MKNISRTNIFKRDYKKIKKQGKDINKLNNVIKIIIEGRKLDLKYRDHLLIGPFKSRRECHLEPDWLLIYRIEKDELILERTGSHTELFE